MHRIDIKKEFKDMFPWHYDPLSSQKQDCPNLGKLDFDFSSLIEHVFELCKKQNPKTLVQEINIGKQPATNATYADPLKNTNKN